jgi:hypothetical protein
MFYYCLVIPSVFLRSPRGMLLLLVHKKHQEKDTPNDTGPAGSPVLLTSGGTPKNSLKLEQVWRLVPPPVPLLSGTEWGTVSLRIPGAGMRYP